MRFFNTLVLPLAALACASATAAPINQVGSSQLAGSEVVTFDEVDTKLDTVNFSSTGTSYDGILISGGVAFGELFVGQVLTTSGEFDVPSGSPTGPLKLQAGAPGQNLYPVTVGVSSLQPLQVDNALAGLGHQGASSNGGIGEGAISILFSSDQSRFGVQLLKLNGGKAYFDFFRNDGSLIQSFTATAASGYDLGFFREAGIKDIRGVTIWNDDPNGIAINNVRHDVASNVAAVPEPGAVAMVLAGGLVMLALAGKGGRGLKRTER